MLEDRNDDRQTILRAVGEMLEALAATQKMQWIAALEREIKL